MGVIEAAVATYRVRVLGTDMVVPCKADESVLAAVERTGRISRGIGCRGGGCGVCRVRVLSGAFESGKVGRNHLSVESEALGYGLACKMFPRGNLEIIWNPEVNPET